MGAAAVDTSNQLLGQVRVPSRAVWEHCAAGTAGARVGGWHTIWALGGAGGKEQVPAGEVLLSLTFAPDSAALVQVPGLAPAAPRPAPGPGQGSESMQ